MRGMLGMLGWRKKTLCNNCVEEVAIQKTACNLPIEFLELLTAKEILEEIFSISSSEVDEMVLQRMAEMTQ